MPYKRLFSRRYAVDLLQGRSLKDVFSLENGGRIDIIPDQPEPLAGLLALPPDTQWTLPIPMQPAAVAVTTPNKRFSAEIVKKAHANGEEYWLQHMDNATGRSRQIRLSAPANGDPGRQPRLAITPQGYFYLVDDAGTVRIYTAPHLTTAGVFQVAHTNRDNYLLSLAASPQEKLIVGLSTWKDIVLYSILERKIVFIRQIRDEIGWYDQGPGAVALAGDGDAILTLGVGHPSGAGPDTPPELSLNIFRFKPLPSPPA